MCMVSAVGDNWTNRLPNQPYWPAIQPFQPAVNPLLPPAPAITRDEFDALKKDVEELRKLLLAAKQFDEATGQPDCEVEDKVVLIKKLASMVGVSMDEIFGSK